MFLSSLPGQEWNDTLPDEGGSTVDGFGMRFCEHLISHQLGLGWKYRIIGEDGLWLVDVSEKQEHQSEPALIDGIEVNFEELKSKDELFNFLGEGSCTHASLMEFCEDYKKQYGNDLCWSYPIAGEECLGEYLVLVREGLLSIPYTDFGNNFNATLDIDAAELLSSERINQLSEYWEAFSRDLVRAMSDMAEFLRNSEKSGGQK